MGDELTPERCLAVYHKVWDDVVDPDTNRGRKIVAEMRAIADALNLDAAVDVVAWWGSGESEDDNRAQVARARALLRGEPSPEVRDERAAVVAYLHRAGYHATAEAIARGEHLEKP